MTTQTEISDGSSPLQPTAAADDRPDGSPDSGAAAAVTRRGFLGTLGAAATALAAGGGVAGLPAMMGADAAAAEAHPADGHDRLAEAFRIRVHAAETMLRAGMPRHPDNGDEDRYENRIGSYSKGLPHDADGEVDRGAYRGFLRAVRSGDPDDFERITLGWTTPGSGFKLVNPQAGLAFDLQGKDPHQYVQPPAPKFSSAEEAGEIVENYWMALLRDVPFEAYDGTTVGQAVADLNGLSDFRGPRVNGLVTPGTLFRDGLPGTLTGPYISQFMWLPTPFGAEFVDRRMRTPVAGMDYMTGWDEWLAIQNGFQPSAGLTFEADRRFITNGRDLSQWVHIDVLFQAYFNACLILGTPPDASGDPNSGGIGCPPNPGNPYNGSQTQVGFGTFGPPGFKTILCEVSTRALKAVWFQKWFVHRRLRPEVFAGRVHARLMRGRNYPIHPDVLIAAVLAEVLTHNNGTYLLPMAFPEGSPLHPAYGAGHATVAGASVTILKALFDETFVIPHPVVPTADGLGLVPYSGPPLTVGGELNKIASNVATGRNIAGVHWRSDAIESLRLGEAVAISILRDHRRTFNEDFGGYTFTKFDGTAATV
jgi:hypothetical protein